MSLRSRLRTFLRGSTPVSTPARSPVEEPQSRLNRPSPLQEAEEILLAKNSKMDLAHKAVVLGNMAEIARNDVDSVRRLQAKHLGPEFKMSKGSEQTGDDGMPIVVCDDYHHHHDINTSPTTAASVGHNWPLAFAVVGITFMVCMTVLLVGGGWLYFRTLNPTPQPQPVQPQPSTNTTVEKKIGFIIDLPGAKK